MSLADRPATSEMAALHIASLNQGRRTLAIRWSDGQQSRLHYVWLRDHCRCAACLHPDTRERLFALVDAPENPRPAAAEITSSGGLRVLWRAGPDDRAPHGSLYDADWLRRHGHSEAAPAGRAAKAASWGAEIAEALPIIAHSEVMESEDGLGRWLELLLARGFAIVDDGPREPSSVRRLAERVGALRWTNFGLIFDVVNLARPNNNAYTALALDPHTDLPNYRSPPDFQLLYCLENEAEGGESILVDGRRAMARLEAENPAAFRLLSSLPITFRFVDEEVEIALRAPVIDLDHVGELRAIRFNNWIRAELDVPATKVEPFYRAYRAFWRLLRDSSLQVHLRLKPGQCLAFDNRRILHARAAFRPTGRRHLEGCYLDREVVTSRLARLRRSLTR